MNPIFAASFSRLSAMGTARTSPPSPTSPKAAVPGGAVAFAGTDMGAGETVLFAGTPLSSRETGVLAAIGRAELQVLRRPRVAILSTGDEIVRLMVGG